ncbi:hypothetical protein [Vampirovibrio chlorellavorus]|uniref:hypothetical protein n=1 Tax=Vampirovibrio chlorellavorus TaxID=758823 RepID=UPI0026EAE31B|nr:hypothetical protein [Vampirovibrio chlorellavorus]
MSSPKEDPGLDPANRWYDNDPVLKRALGQLHQATDKQQAQVALNIIKIVVEHQLEDQSLKDHSSVAIEDLDSALPYRRSWDDHRQHRRWYDMHETLSSAIQLLGDCPEDLQAKIIPSIAKMIEKTLQSGP